MGLNRNLTSSTLALLVAIASLPFVPIKTASASPQQLAQVIPNAVTGRLDSSSQTLNDGSYYNVHTFNGIAGEVISIDMTSNELDAFLILLSPYGEEVARADDSGESTNARIQTTLPFTGTYQIIANSSAAGEIGQYALSWQNVSDSIDPAVDELSQQPLANQQAPTSANPSRVISQSVTGQLDANSQTLQDGRYYAAFNFEVNQFDIVFIEMSSSDFDPYLILLGPDGDVVAETDGSNISISNTKPVNEAAIARLQVPLSDVGSYQILTSSSQRGATGQYALNWQSQISPSQQRAAPGTGDYLVRSQALMREAQELFESGRYSAAVNPMEEALRLRQESFGDDSLFVAQSLSNLAGYYQTLGRYEEAEQSYKNAIAIYRRELGNSPTVAPTLNGLAVLYTVQGRYTEAQSLYEEAVKIWQEQLGDTRVVYIATGLDNLANLYIRQGRYGEANAFAEKALSIRQEIFGERHSETADSLETFAALKHRQGFFNEAENLHLKALEIYRERLGVDHPKVSNALKNTAWSLQAQDFYEEAVRYLEEALRIEESNFSTNLKPMTEV